MIILNVHSLHLIVSGILFLETLLCSFFEVCIIYYIYINRTNKMKKYIYKDLLQEIILYDYEARKSAM